MQTIKKAKGWVLVTSFIVLAITSIPVLNLIAVNSTVYIVSGMLMLLSMFGITGSGLVYLFENEEREKQFAIMYINQQLQFLNVSVNDINERQSYFNELSRNELNNIAHELEKEIASKYHTNGQNQYKAS